MNNSRTTLFVKFSTMLCDNKTNRQTERQTQGKTDEMEGCTDGRKGEWTGGNMHRVRETSRHTVGLLMPLSCLCINIMCIMNTLLLFQI